MSKIKKYFKLRYIRYLLVVILIFPLFIIDSEKEIHRYISYVLFAISIYQLIINLVKSIISKEFSFSLFLMIVASLGALIIEERVEAVMILVIYQLGEALEDYGKDRAKERLFKLLSTRKEIVHIIKENNEISEAQANDIKIGDIIEIKTGEKCHTDSQIIRGAGNFDSSILTGESIPVYLKETEVIKSGMILLDGIITARSLSNYDDSLLSKINNTVDGIGKKKSETEIFITKFAKFYTPLVFLISIIVFLYNFFWNKLAINVSVYEAISILVICCPCAIIIIAPLRGFIALGHLAKKIILVKGANKLENLAVSKAIVYDKTGTLTSKQFKISSTRFNEDQSYVMSRAKSLAMHSNHPLSKCIVESYKDVSNIEISNVKEIGGLGIVSEEFLLGNQKLLESYDIEILFHSPSTSVLIADLRNKKNIGIIEFTGVIKDGSRELVNYLRKEGMKQFIISGDKKEAVEAVNADLKLDGYYSDVTPADKGNILKEIITKNGKCIFVGDGINDVIGAATSSFSFALPSTNIELLLKTADGVLLSGDILSIQTAYKEAKKTRNLIIGLVIFVLITKLIILLLNLTLGSNIVLSILGDDGLLLIVIILCFIL